MGRMARCPLCGNRHSSRIGCSAGAGEALHSEGWDAEEEDDDVEVWSAPPTRRTWFDKLLYSLVGLAVVVLGVLLAIHFLRNNDTAVADARAACASAHPALPSQPAKSATYGQILAAYEAAEAHAAKAAAEDARWNSLNEAYGTEVAYWSASVSVLGRSETLSDIQANGLSNYFQTELNSAVGGINVQQANTTVRSECAVALATST